MSILELLENHSVRIGKKKSATLSLAGREVFLRRDIVNRKTDEHALVTKEAQPSEEGHTVEFSQRPGVLALASQPVSCVILGKLLNLSES